MYVYYDNLAIVFDMIWRVTGRMVTAVAATLRLKTTPDGERRGARDCCPGRSYRACLRHRRRTYNHVCVGNILSRNRASERNKRTNKITNTNEVHQRNTRVTPEAPSINL